MFAVMQGSWMRVYHAFILVRELLKDGKWKNGKFHGEWIYVSWKIMIDRYFRNGCIKEALTVFGLMVKTQSMVKRMIVIIENLGFLPLGTPEKTKTLLLQSLTTIFLTPTLIQQFRSGFSK